MKRSIIIILVLMVTGIAVGQNLEVRYEISSGTHDTVKVYLRSATYTPIDLHTFTTSLVFETGTQVMGHESIFSSPWSLVAELATTGAPISKTYAGQSYQQVWHYGTASLQAAPFGIPGSSDPEVLALKVWFNSSAQPHFYLEDKSESEGMNEIGSPAAIEDLDYVVLHPNGAGLPVEWLSFTAKPVENKVQLDWVTENERQNSGFAIERSTAGEAFSQIGWVDGKGNAVARPSYQFEDDALLPATRYQYRLKQVDLDGKYSYSPIAEVLLSGQPVLAAGEFYPNPASAVSSLDLTGLYNGEGAWEVFEVTGRRHSGGILQSAGSQNLTFSIDVSGYPRGIFMVRFTDESGQSLTRKLWVR